MLIQPPRSYTMRDGARGGLSVRHLMAEGEEYRVARRSHPSQTWELTTGPISREGGELTGEEWRTLNPGDQVRELAIGQGRAYYTTFNLVHSVDPATGQNRGIALSRNPPKDLAVASNGSLLGLSDNRLEVYAPDMRERKTIKLPGNPYAMAHHGPVGLISLRAADKLHRVVSEDGTLRAELEGEPVTPGHVGNDGALWQVLPGQVARLNAQGELTTFPVPESACLALGQADGSFTLVLEGELQQRSASGELLSSTPLEQAPAQLSLDREGGLWLAGKGQVSRYHQGRLTSVDSPEGPFALGVLADGQALVVEPHQTRKLGPAGELIKSYPDPWLARETDGGELLTPVALRTAYGPEEQGWTLFLNQVARGLGRPESLPTPGALRPLGGIMERVQSQSISRQALLSRQAVATALEASAPVASVAVVLLRGKPELLAVWEDEQSVQLCASNGWTRGAASLQAPLQGLSLDHLGAVGADQRGNLVMLDLEEALPGPALSAAETARLALGLVKEADLKALDGVLAHLKTYPELSSAVSYLETTLSEAGNARGVRIALETVLKDPQAGSGAWTDALLGDRSELWHRDPGMAGRMRINQLEPELGEMTRLSVSALPVNQWIWTLRRLPEQGPGPSESPRERPLDLAAFFYDQLDPARKGEWIGSVVEKWRQDERFAYPGAQAILSRPDMKDFVHDLLEPLRQNLRTEGEVRSLVSTPAQSGVENVGDYTRVGAVRLKRRVVFPGEES